MINGATKEGIVLSHAVQQLPLGGQELNEHLIQLLAGVAQLQLDKFLLSGLDFFCNTWMSMGYTSSSFICGVSNVGAKTKHDFGWK